MDPREISGHDALTYMCTHLYVMEMDPNRISVYSALTYMCTHLYVMQLDPSKYNYMSSRWIPVPVHLCQRTEQSVSYSRYGSVPAAVSGLCHLCHLVLSVVCRNWGHGDTPSAHISAMEKISFSKVKDTTVFDLKYQNDMHKPVWTIKVYCNICEWRENV